MLRSRGDGGMWEFGGERAEGGNQVDASGSKGWMEWLAAGVAMGWPIRGRD